MHAQSGWDQEIDFWGHCRIFNFLNLKNSWVGFAVCFGSSSILLWSPAQTTLLHFGREHILIHFRIFPASSGPCHIITKHQKPCATGSHARSRHHTAPPCFTDNVANFGSWAVPYLLHNFFTLVQADLNLNHPKNGFPEIVCFLGKSLIWPCLHPLYLLSWSLLLIVDFDSDSTSWRVFFSWLDVVRRDFLSYLRHSVEFM